MERKIIQSEQIIVPGEFEIGNESILQIYFLIFERGHGSDLPPVLVTTLSNHVGFISEIERGLKFWEKAHPEAVEARREDYRKFFRIAKEIPYVLLDGNHRSAAATLARQPLSALEIQTDEDLTIARDANNRPIYSVSRI